MRNNFFQINVLLTLQVCSLDYKKGFVITLDLVLYFDHSHIFHWFINLFFSVNYFELYDNNLMTLTMYSAVEYSYIKNVKKCSNIT